MTDEEHYIKWRNENSKIDKHNITETSIGHKHIHWNNGVDRHKAYLDGLAEGRKEGYEQGKNNERESQCGKKNYEKDIARLEKENAELKAKLKGFENGDVAWQGDMDTTIKQNFELKEQIEKLKCCENCKHHSFWGDELKCKFFDYDEEMKCLDDKHGWEPAE